MEKAVCSAKASVLTTRGQMEAGSGVGIAIEGCRAVELLAEEWEGMREAFGVAVFWTDPGQRSGAARDLGIMQAR